MASIFVVATKSFVTPLGTPVEVGEVGVLRTEEKDRASIFFIRIWEETSLPKSDFEIVDVTQTGDAFAKKICNVCHKLKETAQFARNQNGINNRPVRRPSCADCRRGMEGTGVSRADRTEWNKKKPTNDAYVCPICTKRTIAGVTSKVVLEHNHRTGKPGGWICDSCNTGLGRFKDDIKLLESAIEFLKKSY